MIPDMQKGRIEFDDPNFRPVAKPADTVPKAFLQFAAPFARVANIIDALPERAQDEESLRRYSPASWPTVGDARRLRDELVRLGWKP